MNNLVQSQNYDPMTGEVGDALNLDSGTTVAVQMAQAELNQAIVTARAYPRNVRRVVQNVVNLTMLDEESASECVYALPRGGKPIKGPSVRFAEIVASMYGNCHVASRVVAVDKIDKAVIAEGVFIDYETGLKRTAQVRRRITDKNGRMFNEDMIVVTGNAASSIAMREAVLKGIPKAIWRKAYESAEQVISGDVKTLVERRDGAVKAFATFGVTPELICAALEIESVEDIDLDQIGTLTSMFKAIKSGEMPVEEYFPTIGKKDATPVAGKKPQNLQQIADDKKAEAAQIEDNKPEPTAEATSAPQGDNAGEKAADTGEPVTASPEAAHDAAEKAPAPDDAQIDAAFQRGKRAGARGTREDAVPPDVKGVPALADAWLDGWREGATKAE